MLLVAFAVRCFTMLCKPGCFTDLATIDATSVILPFIFLGRSDSGGKFRTTNASGQLCGEIVCERNVVFLRFTVISEYSFNHTGSALITQVRAAYHDKVDEL